MQTSGRVIVVGAGIAGLVAGYRLHKAGFEVEVLEATERVGGRMCTDRVNGYIIDRGAQFLSTAYPILLSLMKELGIADKCVKTSPWVAVLRDGMFRRLKQADLLSMLLHGLLEWHEWVSLVWAEARIRGRVRGLPVSDFSAWGDFDDEDTLTWCNRHFRPWMADYIIEPLLGGLYFQTPDEVSKALALATVSVLFRRARTLALLGGLGILPETLASQLTIQLNNPVERLDLRKDTAVVYSAGGDYFADYVISAVPAPVAQVLFDLFARAVPVMFGIV